MHRVPNLKENYRQKKTEIEGSNAAFMRILTGRSSSAGVWQRSSTSLSFAK